MARQGYPAEFRRRVLDLVGSGRKIADVAHDLGVSEQTIYNWRQHFGTMESADVKRLRQLEQENGRLQQLVADRALEIDVMKAITATSW